MNAMTTENKDREQVSPDHFKKIAELTITNSAIIAALATLQTSLLAKIAPLIPDDPEVQGLVESANELRETMAGLQASLGAARKELGLN